MVSMFEIAIAVSLLLSNVGICMAGSRCTRIVTPCLELERQVDPDEKQNSLRPRRPSFGQRPEGMEEIQEIREQAIEQ